MTAEARTGLSAVVEDFDSHARVGFSTKGSNGDRAPRISISPLSIAAVQLAAPSTDSPAPRMINGAVMMDKIRDVAPVYPPLAKMARIQGATDGTVQDAQLICGHPLLAQAAKDAVSRRLFERM